MPSRRARRPDDKRLSKYKTRKPRAKTRWQQLIDGDIGVEDLDEGEIAAGKVRDSLGRISSKAPKLVPRAIEQALRLEFQRRINGRLGGMVDQALTTLETVQIAHWAPADAKVKAAVHVLDRSLGKVPDKLEAQIEVRKFEQDIEGIFVDVVDGEVVEEDDEE
jgi:hypothetical protein